MDYSPQGHKELDTTEGLTLLLLLEAKSNPGNLLAFPSLDSKVSSWSASFSTPFIVFLYLFG